MTTTPVHSITDEQIAEIEKAAKYCVNEVIRSHPWSEMDFDCLRADERYIQAVSPDLALAIITRLREAEKDAARYRWLRDDATNLDGWSPAVAVTDGSYVSYCLDGIDLDEEIDNAMQGDK